MIKKGNVEILAEMELKSANSKYGDTFNSHHECYAVIKEEYEECKESLTLLRNDLEEMWHAIKMNQPISASLELMKTDAYWVIAEAVQVMAMCEKGMKSIEQSK